MCFLSVIAYTSANVSGEIETCKNTWFPRRERSTKRRPKRVEAFPYREVNGSLCYLAMTTRPDIAFEVSQTARFNDCPFMGAIDEIRRIVEYLNKTKDRGVSWGNDPEMSNPVCYGDASHAWDPATGRGTAGHVVMYYGGPVSWRTKSIKLIVRNTRDSECFALANATEALLWTRVWLEDFQMIDGKVPSRLYIDSSALVAGMGDGSFNSSRKSYYFLKIHFRNFRDPSFLKIHFPNSL